PGAVQRYGAQQHPAGLVVLLDQQRVAGRQERGGGGAGLRRRRDFPPAREARLAEGAVGLLGEQRQGGVEEGAQFRRGGQGGRFGAVDWASGLVRKYLPLSGPRVAWPSTSSTGRASTTSTAKSCRLSPGRVSRS